MFQSLTEKLNNAFKFFKNKGKLTEADVKAGMREIKLALLEADVNFKVVRDFIKMVSERAVGAEVMESLLPAQQIVKIVNEELVKLMGTTQAKLTIAPKPPTVVMMVGLLRSYLRLMIENRIGRLHSVSRSLPRSSMQRTPALAYLSTTASSVS